MSITLTDQPTPSGWDTTPASTYPTGGATGWGSWTPTNGDMVYVGVLNRASGSRTISVTPESIGLPAGSRFTAFDVEESSLRAGVAGIDLDMPPESFRLLVVRTDPGVLWADVRLTPSGPLEWTFEAPPTVPGMPANDSKPPRPSRAHMEIRCANLAPPPAWTLVLLIAISQKGAAAR